MTQRYSLDLRVRVVAFGRRVFRLGGRQPPWGERSYLLPR
jgi:hypothetical protein